MESFFGIESVWLLAFACLAGFVAGVVKGAVGFAMPMILISSLSSFLPPQVALAALILPTLATNGVQALRQGPDAAIQSIRRFRVFLLVGMLCLLVSAQMVAVLAPKEMLLMIGIPVILFSLAQLAGWQPRLSGQSVRAELLTGGVAGFVGGVSGVWGPPTVAYLTAIGTPKAEQMRVQGVIYGLGALVLALAHLQSGVLNRWTLPLSVLLLVPAGIGLMIGFRIHDRINQATFRKATLLVLFIAGANLVRRALV